MAGSVNKVILIGRLGRDPEKRSFNNGGSVVNLSVATSESWRDKASGDRKELTEWHRVAIFNEKLGEIAEKYLKKGSAVYLEGKIQTRSYDKDGETRYATEIVLARFGGELTLLDSKASGGEGGGGGEAAPREQRRKEPAGGSFVEDEIPW